jgi:hypothetical protein
MWSESLRGNCLEKSILSFGNRSSSLSWRRRICLFVQTPKRLPITSALNRSWIFHQFRKEACLCCPFHLIHHFVTKSRLSWNICSLASPFVCGVQVDIFIPTDFDVPFFPNDISDKKNDERQRINWYFSVIFCFEWIRIHFCREWNILISSDIKN